MNTWALCSGSHGSQSSIMPGDASYVTQQSVQIVDPESLRWAVCVRAHACTVVSDTSQVLGT